MAWVASLFVRGPKRPVVSDEEREKLGDAAASWLESTRVLRLRVEAFEQTARDMFAMERLAEKGNNHRNYGMAMDDLNFYPEITGLREAGEAWIEQGNGVPTINWEMIGVSSEDREALFQLPWRFNDTDERGRTDELRTLVKCCKRIREVLSLVETALAQGDGPYR